MAESPNVRIENLRKRSRTLLARVEENSKKLNNEIKKYRKENSVPEADYHICGNNLNLPCKQSKYPWTCRNNSNGVSGVLCPDYFLPSPNYASASLPEMPYPGRILIRSNKHRCDSPLRKPVKGCYCHLDVKEKTQLRSARTCHKPLLPCDYCRSHFEIFTPTRRENNETVPLATPLSCETLRKIREIDYEPRSKFLRNIQSKVSLMQNGPSGDYVHPCTKQHDSQTSMKDKTVQEKDRGGQPPLSRTESLRHISNSHKAKSSQISHSNVLVEEEKRPQRESNYKSDKQSQTHSQKSPKIIRKTISSKKSINKPKEDEKKSTVNSRCKLFRLPRRALEKEIQSECHCPEHCLQTHCCGIRDRSSEKMEKLSDREIQRLRTFRDANYFDTHGSSQTLLSSHSSGSLEQYIINDRLFPQPFRRISKEDLVVTIPPCMTKQRKKLHYFPRSVVRQEKGTYNTNIKRRYHGCPLTGHSVDLGILKTRLPLNSLALKYQKRSSY